MTEFGRIERPNEPKGTKPDPSRWIWRAALAGPAILLFAVAGDLAAFLSGADFTGTAL